MLMHPALYTSEAYRRSKIEPGHCRNESARRVFRAFRTAYQMIRSADLELQYWYDQSHSNPLDERDFWDFTGVTSQDECSLAHWFGNAGAEEFDERFETVCITIRAWSLRFRRGFYWPANIPVYIRCRDDWHINAFGVHASLNVITLYGDFFDNEMSNWDRGLCILHEMGTYAAAA